MRLLSAYIAMQDGIFRRRATLRLRPNAGVRLAKNEKDFGPFM